MKILSWTQKNISRITFQKELPKNERLVECTDQHMKQNIWGSIYKLRHDFNRRGGVGNCVDTDKNSLLSIENNWQCGGGS